MLSVNVQLSNEQLKDLLQEALEKKLVELVYKVGTYQTIHEVTPLKEKRKYTKRKHKLSKTNAKVGKQWYPGYKRVRHGKVVSVSGSWRKPYAKNRVTKGNPQEA